MVEVLGLEPSWRDNDKPSAKEFLLRRTLVDTRFSVSRRGRIRFAIAIYSVMAVAFSSAFLAGVHYQNGIENPQLIWCMSAVDVIQQKNIMTKPPALKVARK